MKVLFFTILFFGICNAVAAQPIFIPFEGRREAVKTVEFTPKEAEILKTGKPCGQYFSYEEVADQKIVTFKVSVSDAENAQGIYGFNHIGLNLLKIKIDNKLRIPLIEYKKPEIDSQTKIPLIKKLFVIRLSARDFREAVCLAGLR